MTTATRRTGYRGSGLLCEARTPWSAVPSEAPGHSREGLLHQLWSEQRLCNRPLATDGGAHIHVVFPGWPNRDRGPDFRDAILATEQGRLLRGDVELHVHARDWRAHGHHLDPNYDGVALHVAWKGEPRPPESMTSAGHRVPTVILEGLLTLPLEIMLLAGRPRLGDPRPCARRATTQEQVGDILDREGDARFSGKAAALAGDAAAMGDEQALYCGLLDSLGYTKNRQPFRELAGVAPFRYLQGVGLGKPPGQRPRLLLAILLGASGLLPAGHERGPERADMEATWRAHAGIGVVRAQWQQFRVRPGNSPAHRVAAAAALAERFLVPGLLPGLLQSLDRPSPSEGRRRLCRALMVGAGEGCGALVGAARAGEMAVNVVIPFFHAWAAERGDACLARRCLEIYHLWPPLAENHIAREMRQSLLSPAAGRVALSARRQQGLLGLYARRCHTLACQGCSLALAPEGGCRPAFSRRPSSR